MKINHMIIAMTALAQIVFLSSCAAPSPNAVLQDAVSEQALQGQQAVDLGRSGDVTGEREDEPQEEIYIHVCGAVRSPGVYALPAGSRLYEAIEAAGGFMPEACQDYCNMALTVSDGMQYQIPTEEEALSGLLPNVGQENPSSYDAQGLLDINLATATELMDLPGIGQTRADAIITYREEHGAFACKEDLMQVTGIKGATYEKIESYITVR